MKNVMREVHMKVIFGLGLFLMTVSAYGQWGAGPVLVYDARDGRGNESSFNVGQYRSGSGEFGTLRNDSAYSVSVARGYRVRFCENEGGNGRGSGRCEEYGEGNHNLRYPAQASYIEVTGPGGWGDGWNAGGQQGVTVYTDRNFRGRSESFGVGRYLHAGGQLGQIGNDNASSVVVSRGFVVRLCENEGNDGRGSGRCEDYREGRHNLRYNDEASYVEVRRASGGWFGDRWNNWPGGGGGGDGFPSGSWRNIRDAVVVFTDSNQGGIWQEFRIGAYRADQNEFGRLANDAASSVYVPRGFRVTLCEHIPGYFAGIGRCEEYRQGNHNLRYNDSASTIRVSRD